MTLPGCDGVQLVQAMCNWTATTFKEVVAILALFFLDILNELF